MLGLYAHINIPTGTYKIYDLSTNDAIQLLMTENKWTLSDFTVEYKKVSVPVNGSSVKISTISSLRKLTLACSK